LGVVTLLAQALAVLFAQHEGHTGHGGSATGELVMTIGIAVMLAVVWTALGIVCWIFWRAKKREDAAKREAEVKWQNARSS
jgi:hypothetical protein